MYTPYRIVESRIRHVRLSLKGGEEEKSPFDINNIRGCHSLLDVYPMITLRLPNKYVRKFA
jgi:hypothetical protein